MGIRKGSARKSHLDPCKRSGKLILTILNCRFSFQMLMPACVLVRELLHSCFLAFFSVWYRGAMVTGSWIMLNCSPHVPSLSKADDRHSPLEIGRAMLPVGMHVHRPQPGVWRGQSPLLAFLSLAPHPAGFGLCQSAVSPAL